MTTYQLNPASKTPVVKPGDVLWYAPGNYPRTVINGTGSRELPVQIFASNRALPPRFKGLEVNAPHTKVYDVVGSNALWAGLVLNAPWGLVMRGLFDGSVSGVHIAGDDCVVQDVKCRSNTKMSVNTPTPNYDDSGAFGISVNGDRATIARAQIDNHVATSYDFGTDGSAIEIYDAVGTVIYDIISFNNETFCELGGKTSDTTISDVTILGNIPNAKGLVTRGAQDQFGPVLRTKLIRAGVYLTGRGSKGVVTYGGTTQETLTVQDSVIMAEEALWADGPFIDVSNIWSGKVTRG